MTDQERHEHQEQIDRLAHSEAIESLDSRDSRDSRDSGQYRRRIVQELRHARHAAEMAEARLSAVVEMSPDAIITVDLQGHITLVNRQTEALFGYPRDELLGQSIEQLVPERFHVIHRAHRTRYASDAHQRPMGAQQELVGRRADGAEFPVEISLGSIIMDGETHIMATCRDMTQRTRQMQAESERAERLARMFESMSEGVYIYDRVGQLVQMNAAARAFAEFDMQPDLADQLPQERLRDTQGWLLSPESWPVLRVLRGEVITTADHVELHTTTPAGRERIASVTGSPLHDADGQVVGAALVSRDVTEQRRLEQELAARAQEIESIFETDADAVMLFDTDGRSIRMNAAQRRLFGYEVTGEANYPALEERARQVAVYDAQGQSMPREAWPIYRVLRGETLTNQHAVEMRLRTMDGRELQVSVSGAPVVNGEGQIIGGVTATRDVTAQRQAEQQRTNILRVVAHDLANPIAAVKLYLQTKQHSAEHGAERGAEHGQSSSMSDQELVLIASMTQGSRRMQRLVEDMWVAVGLETRELSLNARLCNLATLCQQEVETIQMATDRDVRIEIPATPVMVHADPDRIGQALANLLSNADKYSPIERPITLTLRLEPAKRSKRSRHGSAGEHAQQALVLVQDHGPGIPSDEQSHIWERFHRIAGVQARPDTGGSLGFGLYICHEIIERHGGAMGVASTPGQGSTFWFTLPLVVS